MRKLFLSLFVACACVCAKAQAESPVLEDGNYVFKYVQQADGVSQSMLYLRAHTFLSDWVGPNSNSRTSIDFDDKETATIIVKGSYFLGYQKEVMYGWNVFADFIVNIKCKDNRFQVITKVPTMSFWWTAGNVALQTIPYNKLYPTYTSPKNPIPWRLSRGIREGAEDQGHACTLKARREWFTKKSVATGDIKSNYNAAGLKGTS